jgi:hypothetical protein
MYSDKDHHNTDGTDIQEQQLPRHLAAFVLYDYLKEVIG